MISITRASEENLKDLQIVSINSFYQAFRNDNSEEDMSNYLENNFNLEKLRDQLKNPLSSFYLVKENQETIGYFKLNIGLAQTDSHDPNALEIERIYLLEQYTGKGVAQEMMVKIIEIAKSSAVKSIWLGVWENNHRAIRFYEKYGFEKFDEHIFMLGHDAQTDWMMRLYL